MLLVYLCVILVAAPFAAGNQSYTPAELKQMMMVGVSNIERETIDAPVTVDHGTVPAWLNGNYMRHSCGRFGETAHEDDTSLNYIQHLFDCNEIGSKFRLYNGRVTFTNRWYDTIVNDIYNSYGGNMNKSSIYFHTTYSKMNRTQVDAWSANMSSPDKVVQVPHVSWWKIGDDAIAMTEYPTGVVIDTEKVEQKGNVPFVDDWIGHPQSDGWSFSNNPAHEHTEADGTLWSTVGVYKFVTKTQIDMKRLVYKVGADKHRHVVGEYQYNKIDLTSCQGGHYPDLDARMGYLHSFSLTEHYIILPEAAYMFDPCFMTHFDKYGPFFPQGFKFENDGFSRLLVMRKSDGKIIANIKTAPFFATHQLGSYEAGDLINMDMLLYDDAGIYDRVTYVNSLLGDNPYLTNVSRITINMTDWSASIRSLRNGSPAAFEMSNINYAYNGRKYTFGYMVKNFDLIFTNAITKKPTHKQARSTRFVGYSQTNGDILEYPEITGDLYSRLNVDTGVEWNYELEDGMFVQEPQFIPLPGGVAEDEGVIIAQGVDGRKMKAFMVIVDAQTMTLIAHVTAPDLALLGLHERFYPISVPSGSTPQIIG